MDRFHQDQTLEPKVINIAGRNQIHFVPSIPYDAEGQEDLCRDLSRATPFSSLDLFLISKMRHYPSVLQSSAGITNGFVFYIQLSCCWNEVEIVQIKEGRVSLSSL